MAAMIRRTVYSLTFVLATLVGSSLLIAQQRATSGAAPAIPRTADGKPNLQGIWQVRNKAAVDLLQERGIVEGGAIPYKPEAAAKRRDNFNKRKTADPLNECFMPGTPRIMYLEYPFHIFQTPEHVAITFEWSQVYRLIYTNGTKSKGIESWMGDSRGRWEGDTLVVDVKDHNDRTWLDAAGNFHSDKLSLVERYTLRDADTLQYEVTITDPDVFTKPWKITMPLLRQKGKERILEFQCQADKEEANGAFERVPQTWYPKPGGAK
jgi:hypothetical protein